MQNKFQKLNVIRDELAQKSGNKEAEIVDRCCQGCVKKYFQTGQYQHMHGFKLGFDAAMERVKPILDSIEKDTNGCDYGPYNCKNIPKEILNEFYGETE